jgi:hypothetical protein
MVSLKAHAAAWTFTPSLSWSADTDSNRSLLPQSTASRSMSFSASLPFTLATETTQLSFSPWLQYQYFDTKAYGNDFERDLNAADLWSGERSKLNITAEDSDRSTLTTEATETGILSSNLHQRLDQVNASATYDQTERYALILNAGYSDVSYYGTPQGQLLDLLAGYRYATASIQEQVQLSETSSLTVSANHSEVIDRLPGNDTLATGGGADYHRTVSERIDFEVSIGGSRVQSQNFSHTSTTGTLSVSRSYALGSVALAYSRSLAPYGTGALVAREQVSLTATRSLTEKLDLSIAASRVQNGQVLDLPELIPQVQTYENAQLGLTWRPAERWNLAGEIDTTHTRTVGFVNEPVHGWRASLSATWTPQPLGRSF